MPPRKLGKVRASVTQKNCKLSHGKESLEPAHDDNLTTTISLRDFKTYLINQPVATVKGN